METNKLVVTHGGNLADKYGKEDLARIEAALETLRERDAARGINTVCVHLDRPGEMEPHGAPPVEDEESAEECKLAIDALCASLSPDYLVLVGADDVIPYFEVPNPTFDPAKPRADRDRTVPTDNPYACSRPYDASDVASYLIPDRVVGRIPDLPGSNDPSWLLDYLHVAHDWTPAEATEFVDDFMVCCDVWKDSGTACVTHLGRQGASLLIAPPTAPGHPADVANRYGRRFQMIKCHGAPLDASFYGEAGGTHPQVLFSDNLLNRTTQGTVVGAMCCYGGRVFDPDDNAAISRGSPPIPSVYLRQGAYGFFGATTLAWVGIRSMQCADWVVVTALRSVMEGASLGRALLAAKQKLVSWIGGQGKVPSLAEKKTLLQFHLLGDPSIHLVPAAPDADLAAASAPEGADASPTLSDTGFGSNEERRARRQHAYETAEQLRRTLPVWTVLTPLDAADTEDDSDVALASAPAVPAQAAAALARVRLAEELEGFEFDDPMVCQVTRTIVQPELAAAGMEDLAAAGDGAVVTSETREYYYTAIRPAERIIDARMVRVETDAAGTVLRTEVLAAC